MFDRSSRADGPLVVQITLADGRELNGNLVAPPGRTLSEVLNGPMPFIEFESAGAPRTFIAKSRLEAVTQLAPAQSK
jgi:hypothetical protein